MSFTWNSISPILLEYWFASLFPIIFRANLRTRHITKMSLQPCSGKGFPFNIGPCLIIGGFKTQCPDVFGKAKPKKPGFTRLWPPLSLVSEKVQELQEGPIRSLKKIMFFFSEIFLLKKAQESPKKINHYLTWSYWSQQRCWEIWQEMSQKFNIPSEKWWLEDYFLSGMAYFQASC